VVGGSVIRSTMSPGQICLRELRSHGDMTQYPAPLHTSQRPASMPRFAAGRVTGLPLFLPQWQTLRPIQILSIAFKRLVAFRATSNGLGRILLAIKVFELCTPYIECYYVALITEVT